RRKYLTFVIVGGGPTGVELAGAIGGKSRFSLGKDFRSINAKSARIVLIEAGPRVFPRVFEHAAETGKRELARVGVQVRTSCAVNAIDANGVHAGTERLDAGTVLWAAGVKASPLGHEVGLETDAQGRVIVTSDLSVAGHPEVFVAGDQARDTHQTGK